MNIPQIKFACSSARLQRLSKAPSLRRAEGPTHTSLGRTGVPKERLLLLGVGEAQISDGQRSRAEGPTHNSLGRTGAPKERFWLLGVGRPRLRASKATRGLKARHISLPGIKSALGEAEGCRSLTKRGQAIPSCRRTISRAEGPTHNSLGRRPRLRPSKATRGLKARHISLPETH